MMERFQQIRLLEAVLFASSEPVSAGDLAKFLPDGADIAGLLEELAGLYANRGVTLVRVGERWAFRSAPDLADLMRLEKPVKRKLSRAAVETLAIVAYHQPVTRAEIEEIRGVGLSRGTLDTLLELGWIKPRGRRRTPGRPVTWGTTDAFLDHFGLEALDALPGQEELKAAGLLDSRPAITSLAARGMLPPGGTAEADQEEGEEALSGEAVSELLDADFGEDLLPPQDEAGDEQQSEQGQAGEGDGSAAGEEGAKRARPTAPAAVEEQDEGPESPTERASEEAGSGAEGGEQELRGGGPVFSQVAASRGEGGS